MKICVVTNTYNEETIIPFFIDHYVNYVGVDKIIIVDGGSKDETLRIAKNNPVCEILMQESEFSVETQLTSNRNNIWKNYRNYDWIIVVDCDEFLYHSNIREKLINYSLSNITIPKLRAFDMYSKKVPEFKKGKFIHNYIKSGIFSPRHIKNIIFNPQKIQDMNYGIGGHWCDPRGEVLYSEDDELRLLHYKNISYDYFHNKYSDFSTRVSDENKKFGYASHVFDFSKMSYEEFIRNYAKCTNAMLSNLIESVDLTDEIYELFLKEKTEYNIISNVPNSLDYAKIINIFGGRLFIVDDDINKIEYYKKNLINNKINIENIIFINGLIDNYIQHFPFEIDLISKKIETDNDFNHYQLDKKTEYNNNINTFRKDSNKNLFFYNNFHNGDIHYSREFVKDIMSKTEFKNYYYIHNNKKGILKDIERLEEISSDELLDKDQSYFFKDENVYINTWIGQCGMKYLKNGLNINANYEMYQNIYHFLNISLNDILEYIPKINFNYIEKENIDNFFKNKKNNVLICNGDFFSKQSTEQRFEPLILELKDKYKDFNFILTDNSIKMESDNIFYSNDIIGIDTKFNTDLLEISYLSTYCDVIIGKESGPFVFSSIHENLMNKNKKFINFSNEISWIFYPSGNCEYIWSNDYKPSSMYNIIENSLKRKNIYVQVGSNRGNDDFQRIIEKLEEKSIIFLIEPNKELLNDLSENYNNLKNNHDVRIINHGISVKNETSELYLYEDSGHSSLIKRKSFPNKTTTEIECVNFNDFCEKFSIREIELLSIDVEGLDYEILYSIDLSKILIKNILFERWAFNDDDLNNKYRTGPNFLETHIKPKYKNYIWGDTTMDGMETYKLIKKSNMVCYKNLGKPGHGQLGNQLFEIAATIGVARDNGVLALFPEWDYNKYFDNPISDDNIDNFEIKSNYHYGIIKYKEIPFQPNMNLHGYFQSDKYFKHHEKVIRELFELKEEYENIIRNRWNHLLKTNTVSIHVRRGDYLDNPTFHVCPPLNYFKSSLNYINSKEKIDNILIFSDDIQWCKENFIDNHYNYKFIEGQNEIEDMFLMSYCNHNIITNSSFSWWGSWLNKNKNKIVCAPHRWFGDEWNMDYQDIYYDNIKIINYDNIDQKIFVFSVCYNEEEILPFYLDYYLNFIKVDKIIIYDGGSTDSTYDIIKKYSRVELIIDPQKDYSDKYLTDMKNNMWKKYKDECDWIIVCDIDEFLYYPDIKSKLLEYSDNGITIPLTNGYDMISLEFPNFEEGKYLPDLITKGILDNHWQSKKIIFKSSIKEINYGGGSHDCQPIGNVKYSDNRDFYMLHYKWLSFDYMTKRYKYLNERRSQWNLEHNASEHWKIFSEMTKKDYEEKYKTAINFKEMKHFYEDVFGWFDFQDIYSWMVEKFPSGSHFVEVGAWLGKSTSYMAVEIINSNKNIKFDVVDKWVADPEGTWSPYVLNDDPYQVFLKNLNPVINYINPIKGDSRELHKNYEDDSIDFIFIDGDHEYDGVMSDIKNWYPKIKKNGIIAGHDYYPYETVQSAVNDYFGKDNVKIFRNSWFVDKRDYELKTMDPEELKILKLKNLEDFMINEEEINEIYIQNELENELLISYLERKNYKKEQNKYTKQKRSPMYIFSHNYLINNWKEILIDQLEKIKNSGLYKNINKLYLFACGDDKEWNDFSNVIKNYDTNNKIEIKRHSNNFYEYYTLQNLWEFCQLNPDSYILYIHLKGVWSRYNIQTGENDEFDSTKPTKNPEALLQWKNCMEYFNIERWYNSVDKLNEGHEVVGALYNYNPDCPLFTGNFWWSNSNYIKKLEYLKFEKEKEPYDVNIWIRIKCEKWINSIPNNFYNLYNPKDLDLYHYVIDPKDYRDDINPLISILTPTYKRYEELNTAIKSVIKQTYINWEMLICSDGDDDNVKSLINNYNDNRIKYYSTERTNNWGSTQRNYLTQISNGKYIIYLDDDNILYPNALEDIINNFDQQTGMIIAKIDYDGLEHQLPINNEIKLGKIDTLNAVVEKRFIKYVSWKNYVGHDYEFIKICENNIINSDKKIKFISNTIGRHVEKTIENKEILIEKKDEIKNIEKEDIDIILKDKIYVNPKVDIINSTINFRGKYGNMIYCFTGNLLKDNSYWFIPDDRSFQAGFIADIIKDNNTIYKSDFIRRIKSKIPNDKIVVFHHNYLLYGWFDILKEQIKDLKESGLYDNCEEIISTIYADFENKNNRKLFKDFIRENDNSNKWSIIDLYENNFEYDILRIIKEYCDNRKDHFNICYFHLKGVCSTLVTPDNIGIPYWRKYLNYFTFSKWKNNIIKLIDNDIVALDYQYNEMHQQYVIGGHFFWTKSSYINKLEKPVATNNRYLPEIWITSKECKVHSNFFTKDVGVTNLYLQPILPETYQKNKIVLVCIAKDEDYYIEEWLNYNFKLGFDKIIIYQNNWKCNINNPNLIKIDWPGEYQQLLAYNDFIDRFSDEYDYAAFFDCDEYLVLKKHKNIHDFIKEHGKERNVCINWQFYGSCGKEKRESNSLIKQFTKRQYGVDPGIKSILYLRIDQWMERGHNPDYVTYDTNNKEIIGFANYDGDDKVTVINHYKDKTLEDFMNFMGRGQVDAIRQIDTTEWHNRKNTNNDIEDLTALKFFYGNNYNTIDYLSGGLLGDFIHQLSIIKENYIKTGKKGNLYIFDNSSNILHTNWGLGVEKAYEDLKDIILNQDYISDFKIYKNEVLNDPINLSIWIKSPLLYQISFKELFSKIYDVEWGKNPWLEIPKNDIYKDCIIVTLSRKRFNRFFDYNKLKELNKKIYFATTSIDEYENFKELTKCNFDLLFFNNLVDLWITINSCYLLVTNPSSFACVAHSLHQKNITLFPNNEEDTLLRIENFENYYWYKNDNENNINSLFKKKINIFHHNYLVGNWKSIVEEEISEIINSGLYKETEKIYATVFSEEKSNYQEFINLIKNYDTDNKWIIIELTENNFEINCLELLYNHCKYEDCYVLYFNNKGVTHDKPSTRSWREYMTYFNINQYKKAIDILIDHDTYGVDLHEHPYLHYSGNFWWSKSSHIRKLDINTLFMNEFNNKDNIDIGFPMHRRHNCEMWVTSLSDGKYYSEWESNTDFYKEIYPSIKYKNLNMISFEERLKKEMWDKYQLNFVFSNQNKKELEKFIDICKSNNKKNILEIGVEYGGTTYEFCKNFDNVYSIDIKKYETWDLISKECSNWKYFVGRSDSDNIIQEIKNSNIKFDVLFIDGDHSYESVKNDFKIYKEFVSEDGLIAFHDIFNSSTNFIYKAWVYPFWEEIKNDYEYTEILYDNGTGDLIDFNDYDYNTQNGNLRGIGLIKKRINKKVIIMTAHPNFTASEQITKESIESFYPMKYDIILSTHCPVSKDIQKSATHFIYDKNNPLIRHDFYNQSWFDREDYFALIKLNKNDNDLQHALAVYINYYNGLVHAKSLGYKTAICTNFDLVFDDRDLKLIDEKIKDMNKQNKKSFFLTSNALEGIHYKTIFFITNIDFFLNNFKYIKDEKNYNEITREVGSETNCLENYFYQTLKNKKDELLLEEMSENDFFKHSRINLFSNIEYFTILPLKDDENNFIIWFSSSNSFDDNRELKIRVLKNDDCIFVKSDKITKNYTYFKQIEFQKDSYYKIVCEVSYNDLIKEKIIEIDNIKFSQLKDNGEFYYKK